jgi:hypothetical protein
VRRRLLAALVLAVATLFAIQLARIQEADSALLPLLEVR